MNESIKTSFVKNGIKEIKKYCQYNVLEDIPSKMNSRRTNTINYIKNIIISLLLEKILVETEKSCKMRLRSVKDISLEEKYHYLINDYESIQKFIKKISLN